MALGLTSTPQGVTKGNDMGGAVSAVTNAVKSVAAPIVDTTKSVANVVTAPLGGWSNVRDTLEAGASVAGNYYLPGSGLLTSKLVSDGAKEALGSNLGTAAMIGSGIAGGISGNMSNYGKIYDSASGAFTGASGGGATPELLGEASGSWATSPSATGAASGGAGILGGAMNWASANPLQAAGLGLTAAKALGGSSTPSSSTSSTSIDPEMKAAYLRNLEEARATAAGLGTKQFAAFPEYSTNMVQQYMNPYQQQVIDASLGDIERQRQQQQLRDRASAVQAKAFGGSRQGVAEALTNEAYQRTAANTAAQLRSQGFTQAQQLALQQEEARRQYEQQKLDAVRNLGLERLGVSQAALGLQPANLGGTQTTPIYKNQTASALGGALSGGMLGNMIGGSTGAGYGALAGGLLGFM